MLFKIENGKLNLKEVKHSHGLSALRKIMMLIILEIGDSDDFLNKMIIFVHL
jgi:hypothetical protein